MSLWSQSQNTLPVSTWQFGFSLLPAAAYIFRFQISCFRLTTISLRAVNLADRMLLALNCVGVQLFLH